VFETSIRYLAGLLSAFELSGQKYPILLEKAKQVGDKLAFAWVGVRPVSSNPREFHFANN
jgi:mannosyl-oligosaccharide alpha-1,2-mannosidase